MRKRILSAFVSAALVVGLVPLPAYAEMQAAAPGNVCESGEAIAYDAPAEGAAGAILSAQEDSGTAPKPTADEIKAAWRALPAQPAGLSIFQTRNDNDAYTPATLTKNAYDYAEAYLNFIRFQAGLSPVTFDDTLNANAAQGALILARLNGKLTHTPATPDGISDEQAKAGKYACATSNLSYAAASPIYPDALPSAIQGQVDDNSGSNLLTLGHRRWLLDPSLSVAGIGCAYAKNSSWNTIYTDIRVFTNPYDENYDASYGATGNTGDTSYDFVAWPASGAFASNVFGMGNPWSVTLNEDEYEKPGPNVAVKVTRASDGKSWTMTTADSSPTTTGKCLIVENSDYGIGNCIIFNPGSDNVGAKAYEGAYSVEVTGLRTAEGADTALAYTVDFFNAGKTAPTIKAKSTSKAVTAKAAKKAAQSFKMGASANSSGKLSYKVLKSNGKVKFSKGTATLKKGSYKKGKTFSIKVRVTAAAKGDYAKGHKDFTLKFKVK